MEKHRFPNAHRRQPELVLGIAQFPSDAATQPFRLTDAPIPDVSIQKQFHSRNAFQSSKLPVGPTMSPRIFTEPAMLPSQLLRRGFGVGGTTSATGSPKRVTRTGMRVLRTCSRMPRHLALNSEMATSFMPRSYYAQLPWATF